MAHRKSTAAARSVPDAASPAEPTAMSLLVGVAERHERAFPGNHGAQVEYFAHLAGLRQLVEIFYARLLKPYRISYSEYRVLGSLRVREQGFRTTPHDLNRLVQLTSAGITRTLDRLESAGYVERTANPSDRRSVLVGLTPEGWEFGGEVAGAVSDAYAEVLAGLDEERLAAEQAALLQVIERLQTAISR